MTIKAVFIACIIPSGYFTFIPFVHLTLFVQYAAIQTWCFVQPETTMTLLLLYLFEELTLFTILSNSVVSNQLRGLAHLMVCPPF